jgi:hypothetical protein
MWWNRDFIVFLDLKGMKFLLMVIFRHGNQLWVREVLSNNLFVGLHGSLAEDLAVEWIVDSVFFFQPPKQNLRSQLPSWYHSTEYKMQI